MKRLRKGRKNVISHREARETDRGRATDGREREAKEGDDVSPRQRAVLSLCLLEVISVLLLLFLGIYCYWMASTWQLHPIAHLQITWGEIHIVMTQRNGKKYRQNVNNSVSGYTAYSTQIWKQRKHIHTHTLRQWHMSLSKAGRLTACVLREHVIKRCDSMMTLALRIHQCQCMKGPPDNLVKWIIHQYDIFV